jgi:hypothetical protein
MPLKMVLFVQVHSNLNSYMYILFFKTPFIQKNPYLYLKKDIMKNLYLLPTDQQSRLVKIKDTFFLTIWEARRKK